MSYIKDELIDKLLCFMKDEIERQGHTPKTYHFDFNQGAKDFVAFKTKTNLNDEEISKLLKTSYSRGYITLYCTGGGELFNLTTEGHGRAISCERAKSFPKTSSGHNINIGTIYGPAQIGDYNTQKIEAVFEYIVNGIENAEAPKEQKEQAKSLFRKALEHPITSAVIGAGVSVLISKLGGGKS